MCGKEFVLAMPKRMKHDVFPLFRDGVVASATIFVTTIVVVAAVVAVGAFGRTETTTNGGWSHGVRGG